MSSEISVSLTISGADLDFSHCTAAIGIAPTSTFVRKFDYDSSLVPEKQWTIECAKQRYETVDDATRLLLDKLSGLEENISAFASANSYKVEICCSIAIYEDRPLYELGNLTLKRLAKLNADFLMDIVDYSEN